MAINRIRPSLIHKTGVVRSCKWDSYSEERRFGALTRAAYSGEITNLSVKTRFAFEFGNEEISCGIFFKKGTEYKSEDLLSSIPTEYVNAKIVSDWEYSTHAKRHNTVVYESDFTYFYKGVFVVEDVKGMYTDVYLLKKKLMRSLLGVVIKEVEPNQCMKI